MSQLSEPDFPYLNPLDGITVKEKRGWVWRALALLMRPVNRRFASFWHAVGNTIYVPVGWHRLPRTVVVSLMQHEREHVMQMRKLTVPLFALLYYLLPLPVGLAYFRYRFERAAYAAGINARQTAIRYSMTYPSRKLVYRGDIAHAVEMLTGKTYLWTWPFKRSVRRWLEQNTNAPAANPIPQQPVE